VIPGGAPSVESEAHSNHGRTLESNQVGRNLPARRLFLDPANVPGEILLQWYNGTWEHGVYWGANLLNWCANGTAAQRPMGSLPPAGQTYCLVRGMDDKARSAELHSAVSQNCILRGVSQSEHAGTCQRPADWKSAIQQIENLRYGSPVDLSSIPRSAQ